ncbi:MAG: DUF4255 domain-containing protein [Bacteroidetes bacterium]|nr:DUF4255 domain-containing protein [Bacteroidota bacterium]
MSTALRIASVTQVLKDLLNNGLIDHDVTGATGGNVIVTSWPPDKIDTAKDSEASQLNLFMYQATYNQGWRNAFLPSVNQKGERVTNPSLALDLHYLLTAYGAAELHTDILLGYGMQLLHEIPVLGRDAIRTAIAAPTPILSGTTNPPVTALPDSLKLLSGSALAEQVEQIKISPEVLTFEDISKLWTAFGAKYRPTAAYKVTVVLIESTKSTKPALPVRERNIYALPFKQPVIESIASQKTNNDPVSDNQKILPGYSLLLKGYQFYSENVSILIDGEAFSGAISAEDKQVSFQLPDDAVTGLQAGIHEVQVVHQTLMGSPPVAHTGVMSTASPFVLSPLIVNVGIPVAVSGPGIPAGSLSLTLKVNPAIRPGQRVALFMNEKTNNSNAKAYSFVLPPFASPPQPMEDIVFTLTNVKSAAYLLRIQVDGAESPLESNPQGEYHLPAVIIP